MAVIRITDDQRRARLAQRHGLHPEFRVDDVDTATERMTVLHATEPASVYLSLQARIDNLRVEDVDSALYEHRSLVKQLAMRRTLFVFPRDLLPLAWGSISARVAETEARRLAKDIEAAGIATDGRAWLDSAIEKVINQVADGSPASVATLRSQIPELESIVTFGGGKWAQQAPVAPRVVTTAGARGAIVRGTNASNWRTSRPQWTSMESWLGQSVTPASENDGYAELVRRWLYTFGPGTEADIVWWFGTTKSAVRTALADISAVEVKLDSGDVGYVLPDDVDPVDAVSDWACLLPTLDPTAMGWKQRDFYFAADDVPFLMDRAGNIGTTAWWNGRIVGCWIQDDDGRVVILPRAPLPSAARDALEFQAQRLTTWLDGTVISTIYRSPQMKGQQLP